MTYGITGNPTKDALWVPLRELMDWMDERGLDFHLDVPLADGLRQRGMSDVAGVEDVSDGADVLLSFGGDGTMLRTAHRCNGTPILGVNMGRLGFLTKVEVSELESVLTRIEAGDYGVEERMTLSVESDADLGTVPTWALNDVVADKSGTTSMIQVEATVDGRVLNTYWADGLVIATPTGSTAYALSVGGPILVPGTEAIVVAPIAPHTLTARPIVLPCDAVLDLVVQTRDHPFAFACDGVSTILDGGVRFRIQRSSRTVQLVTLPDRDYFGTIRSKLSWGQGGVF